jgi:membrane protease YdiL (CAAX protease family)
MPETVYWMTPIGWYHLLTFSVLVPVLAWMSRRRSLRADAPKPPLARFLRSTCIMLALFAVLSCLTAWQQDLSIWSLAIRRPLVSIPLAVGLYVLAVAVMRPRWRRAVETRLPHLRYFMPHTAGERRWWVVVSVSAGVSEEITWRGVQPPLLAYVTGSPLAGIALSAVMFGAGHAMQGFKSAAVIVIFALAFQALVWTSGSLLLAMIVHAVYDITAGFTYSRLGRELGYDPDGVRPGSDRGQTRVRPGSDQGQTEV